MGRSTEEGRIGTNVDSGVAVVFLDRPSVNNSMNKSMVVTLNQTLSDLGRDKSLRVIILTGTGTSFGTGENLKEVATFSDLEFEASIRAWQDLTRTLFYLPQPVIAAVDGYAFGGGLESSLACDLRIASERATFCLPEVNIGQVITNATSILLSAIVGEGLAKEIALTGEPVNAQRAFQIGLVNRVVPHDQLMTEAHALADRIKSRAPNSVRLTKRVMNEARSTVLEDALDREVRAIAEVFATQDAREGIAAFLEKRSPAFLGL